MVSFEGLKQLLQSYKFFFEREFSHTKLLVRLIKKSIKEELTLWEKKIVRAQTFNLLKILPAFAVFMLPGGTLWLFLLIKLMPGILPSSFRANTIKNKD